MVCFVSFSLKTCEERQGIIHFRLASDSKDGAELCSTGCFEALLRLLRPQDEKACHFLTKWTLRVMFPSVNTYQRAVCILKVIIVFCRSFSGFVLYTDDSCVDWFPGEGCFVFFRDNTTISLSASILKHRVRLNSSLATSGAPKTRHVRVFAESGFVLRGLRKPQTHTTHVS